VVQELHAAGAVGSYDAAVVTEDDAGKVHVHKDGMTPDVVRHARSGAVSGG
jgi:hypothetical protein